MRLALALFVIATIFSSGGREALAQTRVVSGQAEVTDGDTIVVAGTKIRLQGIDAPETDQSCLDAEGKDWSCGIAARDELFAKAGRSIWRYALLGRDRYERMLGTCMADGTDINCWMVAGGWALAFVRYSKAYEGDESEARAARRGLWAGAFLAPWEWRRRNCQTEMYSAQPISIEAHRRLCGNPADPPSPECGIKGNLKGNGCIYHSPKVATMASSRWMGQDVAGFVKNTKLKLRAVAKQSNSLDIAPIDLRPT